MKRAITAMVFGLVLGLLLVGQPGQGVSPGREVANLSNSDAYVAGFVSGELRGYIDGAAPSWYSTLGIKILEIGPLEQDNGKWVIDLFVFMPLNASSDLVVYALGFYSGAANHIMKGVPRLDAINITILDGPISSNPQDVKATACVRQTNF